MKINMNNVKKFAAMGLVLVSATSLAGCKTTLNEVITYKKPESSLIEKVNENIKKPEFVMKETTTVLPETKVPEAAMPVETTEQSFVDEEICLPVVPEPVLTIMPEPEETEPVVITEPVIETPKSLLERYEESPIVSDDLNQDITTYYTEHIEEINDILNPEYHDIHVKYGSLIYQRLVNAGIQKETILGELANVILEQQLPRCVSEEEWINNFGNIVSVLGETESMYEAYFCLSYLVHDEICELEHGHNEFGAVTCDELQTGFQKKYSMQ